MALSDQQLLQLTVAMAGAICLYAAAYFLPSRWVILALVVTVPFQLISSKFGTSNIAAIMLASVALFLRGKVSTLRFGPAILAVLAMYGVALVFAPTKEFVANFTYIIAMVSAALLFWIVYNFVRSEGVEEISKALVVTNVLVLVYCGIQIYAGPGQEVVFFGIDELSLHRNRGDGRITGPFSAVGITAEYLVISIMLMLPVLLRSERKTGAYLLIFANLAVLVGTANRGGIISLVMGTGLFLYMFRQYITKTQMASIVLGLAVMLMTASWIVVTQTQFDGLYERLEGTELKDGIPDTRAKLWPKAVEEIKESPWVGHGPRYRTEVVAKGSEKELEDQYPHNLYLFILYNAGFAGLLAFGFLYLSALRVLARAARSVSGPGREPFLASAGMVVLLVVAVDQMKVEFLRFALTDYWHYLAVVCGLLVGTADRVLYGRRETAVRKDILHGGAAGLARTVGHAAP